MPVLTLRQTFAEALRRQWDTVRGLRAIALWRIERDTEEVRRQTLPERERRILVLNEERALTSYIDSSRSRSSRPMPPENQALALNTRP